MDALTLITFFCGLSFLVYGTSCLHSNHMKREFARFGYPRQRKMTGVLQLLGALGLLLGYYLSPGLAFSAAIGLMLLMSIGFGVRLKIRDPLYAASPALLYALLNLYLAVNYGQKIS
jgi:uncharacterized membrane protein YphA (DoxX/SURF4 family)